MKGIIILIVIFVLPSFVLAAPAVTKNKSAWQMLVKIGMSFVVVVLPLFVFFLSYFLLPDWKGGCVHGWIDCFISGKSVLAPIVLWATAALYAVEILRVEKPMAKWIILGISLGAITAIVCLAFGLFSIGWQAWMLVPAYVTVWYSFRAIQLMWAAKLNVWIYFCGLLSSLPFWILSVLFSKSLYASLPDKAPDCFIVTAAGRGHKKFVGPFQTVEHNGNFIEANEQLATFWQFEEIWRSKSPRSHENFRRIYNRVGPILAARIKSAWLADLIFAAIKPAEVVAKFVNRSRR